MSMTIGNSTAINSSYQNITTKASEYKNVREYSNYLSSKYACLTPGKNASVSVTSGLLRKAMNDEETGQWLERELSKAPDYIKKAQQSAIAHGSRLISVSIEFGEEYSTMTTIGVFGESGTDSAIDKWLERIKENKEEEKETGEPYTMQFKGKDLDDLMQNMLRGMQAGTDFSNLAGRFNITI